MNGNWLKGTGDYRHASMADDKAAVFVMNKVLWLYNHARRGSFNVYTRHNDGWSGVSLVGSLLDDEVREFLDHDTS